MTRCIKARKTEDIESSASSTVALQYGHLSGGTRYSTDTAALVTHPTQNLPTVSDCCHIQRLD